MQSLFIVNVVNDFILILLRDCWHFNQFCCLLAFNIFQGFFEFPRVLFHANVDNQDHDLDYNNVTTMLSR